MANSNQITDATLLNEVKNADRKFIGKMFREWNETVNGEQIQIRTYATSSLGVYCGYTAQINGVRIDSDEMQPSHAAALDHALNYFRTK